MRKSTSLTVFVVRHGERLDEYLKRQGDHGRDFTTEFKVDPPLTVDGHRQAQEAFSRLADGFRQDGRKRKVALFSSPTKRTMGTSLMVASSTMMSQFGGSDTHIEWGFQDLQRSKQQEQLREKRTSTTTTTTINSAIPVIVLNGLSSCAARIAKCGGADEAVKSGLLACADCDTNDGSSTCPAAVELQKMVETLAPVVDEKLISSQKVSANVQYLKIQKRQIVPLVPPVSLCRTTANAMKKEENPPFVSTEERLVQGQCCRVVEQHYCLQKQRKEYFWQALDRAVLLAESEECDTVIVVAHREGVREMLERWKSNGHEVPRRLNYCCIASFKVKLLFDEDNYPYPRWRYHGVVDYQDFSARNIP